MAMTKTTPRKFQTLRQQRDELASAFDAKHGRGAAKRLFAQKLGSNKNVLKRQIDLLAGLVDAADIGKATTSMNSPAKTKASNPSPAKTITRAQFNTLSPREQSGFCLSGGKIVN
jgi:hypothetical protein